MYTSARKNVCSYFYNSTNSFSNQLCKSNKCFCIVFPFLIKTLTNGKTYGFLEFVRDLGHYLYGESNRSVIWTLSPAASCSNVSRRGLVRSDTMSDIVDFGSPVIIETWRIVNFRLYIISPSKILIALYCHIFVGKDTGK